MQLSHERMEGALIDERYLDIFAFAEVLFENSARPHTSIAAAKNEEFFCCHYNDPIV